MPNTPAKRASAIGAGLVALNLIVPSVGVTAADRYTLGSLYSISVEFVGTMEDIIYDEVTIESVTPAYTIQSVTADFTLLSTTGAVEPCAVIENVTAESTTGGVETSSTTPKISVEVI